MAVAFALHLIYASGNVFVRAFKCKYDSLRYVTLRTPVEFGFDFSISFNVKGVAFVHVCQHFPQLLLL